MASKLWLLCTTGTSQQSFMRLEVGPILKFAHLCYGLFGDYVQTWVTINEPKQICHGGYANSGYAPGIDSKGVGEYLCAKHVLLAHAKAWRIYDTEFRSKQNGTFSFDIKQNCLCFTKNCFLGRNTIVIDSDWYEPTTYSAEDEEAAETKRQFVVSIYGASLISGIIFAIGIGFILAYIFYIEKINTLYGNIQSRYFLSL